MNKEQFFNKHRFQQIEQQELDRKWRVFNEQKLYTNMTFSSNESFSSGAAADFTIPGPVWDEPSGFLGYYEFNGTDQLLSVPGSADFAPGTGDFTIEFIIKKLDESLYPRVFSVGTYPDASIACSIETGSDIYFWIGGEIAASIHFGDYPDFPGFLNRWHHLVLQRKSGTCQIYIDGNKLGDTTDGNVFDIVNTTDELVIACEPEGVGTYMNFMNTYLTNFRWTNSAIYDDEFTVPHTELIALSSTKLLLTMSTSGAGLTDTSGANHDATAVNTPVYHTNP